MFWTKKPWLYGLFSWDKDDYNDVWMIKITIKTNEIDMFVLSPAFLISVLVCKFKPHKQTWYPKIYKDLYVLVSLYRKKKLTILHILDLRVNVLADKRLSESVWNLLKSSQCFHEHLSFVIVFSL